MKLSSILLRQFVAALREEGADLPESDENTISTLTDALDGFELDINFPEQDRTVHTLWLAANTALDPDFKESEP